MKTIIELYDREPIENLLSTIIFQPEHVVYITGCDAPDAIRRQAMERALRRHAPMTRVHFLAADAASVPSIFEALRKAVATWPDCIFDFTGGRDLMLLSSGLFCQAHEVGGFFIDLPQGRFVDVFRAGALKERFQMPRFSIGDVLDAAGGSLQRHGHFVEGSDTREMETLLLRGWEVCRQNPSGWGGHVSYLQHVTRAATQADEDALTIRAERVIRVNAQHTVRADADILRALSRAELIQDLKIGENRVSFRYPNAVLRGYLTNYGIWLELFAYITAKRMDYFDDVGTSIVIDWNGKGLPRSTQNEVDLILVRGIAPIFISCKAGIPDALALDEIKLLSYRFGGALSKSVLLTAAHFPPSNALYQRARDMDIKVIDAGDLEPDRFSQVLMSIAEDRYVYQSGNGKRPRQNSR